MPKHKTNQSERFIIMERRLYKGILWPAALLTTGFGLWLIHFNVDYYLKAGWMHAKLSVVFITMGLSPFLRPLCACFCCRIK